MVTRFRIAKEHTKDSVRVSLPKSPKKLRCRICKKLLSNRTIYPTDSPPIVSTRSIEYQLACNYNWISIPKKKYVECWCVSCAELELEIPRIT